MKMNDTVARIVEIMFQDVEMNDETQAIRDEVMNNCQERFLDLVASGVPEDDAIDAVIDSLKGMEEVLAPYKKKENHVASMVDDEESGERKLTFAAEEIQQISVKLVSEDICIENSNDNDYHVIWSAEEAPLLDVTVADGVLKVERVSGEPEKKKNEGRNARIHMDNMEDFIRTEEGKIEINMESISRMLKSVGEKLKLQIGNGVSFGFRSTSGVVTIQVPAHAIPCVKLLTASGDIEVKDVCPSDMNITSTSGDINVDLDERQNIRQIEMRTTSGDMEVCAFAERASIASTSGDVDVDGRYNMLSISTISGDIDVRADVAKMNFSAISGDVDLIFDSNEIRKVSGSTVSGDIDIALPDGIGSMAIQTKTNSGDVITRCHTDGVGPTVSGGVSSMSGDITIR